MEPLSGLPLPDVVNWPIFPFAGDIEMATLRPFADVEHVRPGDPGGPPCGCSGDPEAFQPRPAIWENERWIVRPIAFGNDGPSPIPAYMLETVRHMDFDDFDDELAADLGLMSVRLERAIRGLGTVGRVHINRWGDGGSHFHMWFLGRPKGAWQLSGFTLPLWAFSLPPMEAQAQTENDRRIAASLDAAASSAG
jgi:hypothetical protein